jgi:hypothetical protein
VHRYIHPKKALAWVWVWVVGKSFGNLEKYKFKIQNNFLKIFGQGFRH